MFPSTALRFSRIEVLSSDLRRNRSEDASVRTDLASLKVNLTGEHQAQFAPLLQETSKDKSEVELLVSLVGKGPENKQMTAQLDFIQGGQKISKLDLTTDEYLQEAEKAQQIGKTRLTLQLLKEAKDRLETHPELFQPIFQRLKDKTLRTIQIMETVLRASISGDYTHLTSKNQQQGSLQKIAQGVPAVSVLA